MYTPVPVGVVAVYVMELTAVLVRMPSWAPEVPAPAMTAAPIFCA